MEQGESVKYFGSEDIHQSLDYLSLVEALRLGFTKEYVVPSRMHISYDDLHSENKNTLLLMPAINQGADAGIKIVNVAPANSQKGISTIQGIYYLMDAITGSPKALMEAKTLTNWRTAAASALAASFLAPKHSQSLLMVGTGSLAPYLIDAHAAIRPIKELMIYGRTPEKAQALAAQKSSKFEKVEVVNDLKEAVGKVDVISVATLSSNPLIEGNWLRPCQHIDLVGSYRPDMRESDDQVLKRSKIFVDNLESAPKETGDLVIPIESGSISLEDIEGDLFQLCSGEVQGRQKEDEITVFKSVGHALEDLVAAQLIFSQRNNHSNPFK